MENVLNGEINPGRYKVQGKDDRSPIKEQILSKLWR